MSGYYTINSEDHNPYYSGSPYPGFPNVCGIDSLGDIISKNDLIAFSSLYRSRIVSITLRDNPHLTYRDLSTFIKKCNGKENKILGLYTVYAVVDHNHLMCTCHGNVFRVDDLYYQLSNKFVKVGKTEIKDYKYFTYNSFINRLQSLIELIKT